jgi:hypothetical protein
MIECKYCSTIVFYKFSKVCRADVVKNKSTSARFNILSFLFLVVSIGEAYPYLKSLLNKHTLHPIYPLHKIIMYIRNICLSLSSSLSVKVTFQISRFHFSKKKKTETQPENQPETRGCGNPRPCGNPKVRQPATVRQLPTVRQPEGAATRTCGNPKGRQPATVRQPATARQPVTLRQSQPCDNLRPCGRADFTVF